jgi:hypothetical protein
MGRCDSQCRRTSAGDACICGTAARATRRRAVRLALARHRLYGHTLRVGQTVQRVSGRLLHMGQNRSPPRLPWRAFAAFILEPVDGIELTTCCLQNHCLTRTGGVKGRQKAALFGIAKPNNPYSLGHIWTSADVQPVRDTVRDTHRAGGAA